MESLFNWVWQNILNFPNAYLFSIYSRTFVGYLACAFLIGAGVYYWNHRKESWRFKDMLGYLFPARVYTHRAFRMDLKLIAFNYILSPVRLLTRVASIAGTAWLVSALMRQSLIPSPVFDTPERWAQALIGLGLLAVYELAQYTSHYMHHKVPWLWAFHAIHHEPEQMNPMTLYRHHPMEELIKNLLTALMVGLPCGVLIALVDGDVLKYYLLAISLVYKGLFSVVGSNLQHSHIWLNWGYPFNHLFISPAQHQCHHSKALQHRDVNFGGFLAIYDAMFGTLYCPKGKEEIEFGIEGRESHSSLLKALIEPFQTSWGILARKWAERRARRKQLASH